MIPKPYSRRGFLKTIGIMSGAGLAYLFGKKISPQIEPEIKNKPKPYYPSGTFSSYDMSFDIRKEDYFKLIRRKAKNPFAEDESRD